LHALNDWTLTVFSTVWVTVFFVQGVSLLLFLGYTLSASDIERRGRRNTAFRGQSIIMGRFSQPPPAGSSYGAEPLLLWGSGAEPLVCKWSSGGGRQLPGGARPSVEDRHRWLLPWGRVCQGSSACSRSPASVRAGDPGGV